METLVGLLKAATDRYGERVALCMKPGIRTQRWRYADLWRESGRMAGYLLRRGIGKGDRVVIWAPNTPEWVISLLGCLRAGVVAVPVDLRSTPDFVVQVEKSTAPRLRLASRLTPPRAGLAPVPELSLESLWPALDAMAPFDEADLPPPPTSDDLAEILFTSGTTGDPKGVMLTHGSIASDVAGASPMVPMDRTHRLLSLLPLSHMFEQTVGLFLPLRQGFSIVFPTSRQPTVIFRTLAENRVTTIVLVPQALQLFWGAIERQVRQSGRERLFNRLLAMAPRLPRRLRRLLFFSLHRRLGGRLRLLICGGAYLDPALAAKWDAVGIQVAQGYGATEASPILTGLRPGDSNLASVGKAIRDVEVRIAPDGEILARGPNITPGYWQNEKATAEAFEGDWYRTGDLGEVDAAGYLYLRGRKKNLIVLANGQNVFPEDIEAVLVQQPGVKDAIVVGLPRGGEVEVHAVFLAEDAAACEAAVRAANGRLADHQRIHGFTRWPGDDLPRTHTLKVKRGKVLEYLQESGAAERAAPELPATGLATEGDPLHRILAELSGQPVAALRPEATLGDDLGLDSLRRVELLSTIEAELGAYIDDTAIGPDTTVADLAEKLAAAGQTPPIHFAHWPLLPPVAAARDVLQQAVVFPVVRRNYGVRVEGTENLRGLEAPVIFAANHSAQWDVIVIPMAMPHRWRAHLAIVAAAEKVFHERLRGFLSAFLGNAFPFDRYNALRPSMEYLGKLLDDGWNILIFPEGDLYKQGIQPFKSGTGLIATEAGTPVVPVGLRVVTAGRLEVPGGPRRSEVVVRFGAPLTFPRGTTPAAATLAIETAVRALVPGQTRAVDEVAATAEVPAIEMPG
jgi:long-chain acyl-CoA synthetase